MRSTLRRPLAAAFTHIATKSIPPRAGGGVEDKLAAELRKQLPN